MSRRESFTCTITRDSDGRFSSIEVQSVDLDDHIRRVRVNGSKAPHIASALHQILRAGGVTAREWNATRPIDLRQTTGAHAQLLLSAVKPLRRAARIDEVADGVAGMSREEASYWHAKAQRRRGLAALRLLLSSERR